MKIFGQYVRWLIIGVISTALAAILFVFGIFYLGNYGDEIRYSKIRAAGIVSRNEESFETVRQFIGGLDYSAYDAGEYATYTAIWMPDVLPGSSEYEMDVYADQTYEEQISDPAVNTALDTLFRKAHIDRIIQTRNEQSRSVFFAFSATVGVVYSRSGDEPGDRVEDGTYTFRRIDEHWFYWTHHWD